MIAPIFWVGSYHFRSCGLDNRKRKVLSSQQIEKVWPRQRKSETEQKPNPVPHPPQKSSRASRIIYILFCSSYSPISDLAWYSPIAMTHLASSYHLLQFLGSFFFLKYLSKISDGTLPLARSLLLPNSSK